jgi:Flp pilus assembly pilin Flp
MPKGILILIGNSRSRREAGRNALTYVQMLFARLWVVNSGAAASEYTFLVAFVAIVAVLGMVLVGDDLQLYFSGLANGLDNASTPTPDPFAT